MELCSGVAAAFARRYVLRVMATARLVLSFLLLGGLLLSITTCARTKAPAVSSTARDSSGVRIVENAVPESDDHTRWATVQEEVAVAIGSVDGQPAYQFWRIGSAVQTPEGDIVVADAGSREIRVFDGEGTYRSTLGRQGRGPGEFEGEPVIRLMAPDTIVAWDPQLRRMTWFRVGGALLKDRTLTGTEFGRRPLSEVWATRWDVVPGRALVGQHGGLLPLDAGDGTFATTMSLLIVDISGDAVRWLRGLPGETRVLVGDADVPADFTPTVGRLKWAVRVATPSIVVADDSLGRWILSEYDLAGRLRMSVRASIPRRPVTPELVQRWRRFQFSLQDGLGARNWSSKQRRDYATAVNRVPIPDSTQAITAILVDTENRLWVRRWTAIWEDFAKTGGRDVYDVVDTTGLWLGTVTIDRAFGRLLSISEENLLFQWTDPAGEVPQVRLHRLVRTGTAP